MCMVYIVFFVYIYIFYFLPKKVFFLSSSQPEEGNICLPKRREKT